MYRITLLFRRPTCSSDEIVFVETVLDSRLLVLDADTLQHRQPQSDSDKRPIQAWNLTELNAARGYNKLPSKRLGRLSELLEGQQLLTEYRVPADI
jgi:hypothetical protein